VNLQNVTRHFTLIRSKDAGPFMLTLDIFFSSAASQDAFRAAGVFDRAVIAELYAIDPAVIEIHDMPQILALKISFPRRIVSGSFGDTDITGGQQYAVLVDLIATLHIEGDVDAGYVVAYPNGPALG
jgi:hypothetical protein